MVREVEEVKLEERRQGLRVGGILVECAEWGYGFAGAGAAGAVAVAVVVESQHDPSRVSSVVSQRLSLSSGVVAVSRFP